MVKEFYVGLMMVYHLEREVPHVSLEDTHGYLKAFDVAHPTPNFDA